jgi:hypothetical protein
MLAIKEGHITIPPWAEIARLAGSGLMAGGISLRTICTLHVVRQLGYTSLDAGNTRFNSWNIVLVYYRVLRLPCRLTLFSTCIVVAISSSVAVTVRWPKLIIRASSGPLSSVLSNLCPPVLNSWTGTVTQLLLRLRWASNLGGMAGRSRNRRRRCVVFIIRIRSKGWLVLKRALVELRDSLLGRSRVLSIEGYL